MTQEKINRSLRREDKRLSLAKASFHQATVTDDDPLTVSFGGGEIPALGMESTGPFSAGDRVTIAVWERNLVVLDKLTADPQGSGGGGGISLPIDISDVTDLQDELDALASTADLTAHAADTTAVHGISDTADLAVKPVTQAQSSIGTGSTHLAAGDDARFPSTGQKNALAGEHGTPGTTNKYLTKQSLGDAGETGKALNADDPTTTDDRTPTDHAASHADGGSDELTLAAAQISNLAATVKAYRLDEFDAPDNDLDFDGHKITDLGAAEDPTDAVNLSQLELLLTLQLLGFLIKGPVFAATNAPLGDYTVSGGGLTLTSDAAENLEIDGLNLSATHGLGFLGRVLVKDEVGADAPNNGLYDVIDYGGTNPWVLERTADEVAQGTFVQVLFGDTNARTAWYLVTDDPITVGSDDIEFLPAVSIPGGPASGDLDGSFPNPTIANGAITLAKIAAALKPSGSASATDESLRRLGTGSTHAAAGDDSRFPTAGQKNALAGAHGTPGTGTEYLTKSSIGAAGVAGKALAADDATTTNARTPTAHKASHLPGGSDALDTAAAGAIQPDDSAATGTATSFARSDHRHAIAAASAGAITGANAEGASTSFARADHDHALPAFLWSTWQLLHETPTAYFPLDAAAAAYFWAAAQSVVIATGFHTYQQPTFRVRVAAADFGAVTGKTLKLRIRLDVSTNGTDPNCNVTATLRPLSHSGAADVLTQAFGAAVGNSAQVTNANLATNETETAVSAVFNLPTDGLYALVVENSAAIANNAVVHASARLEYRWE